MDRHDIILDENWDLQADSSGDFKVGDGSNQQIALLIVADYGHYINYPTRGVGVYKYLNAAGDISSILEGDIIQEMKLDGFKTPFVDAEDLQNIKVNSLNITL